MKLNELRMAIRQIITEQVGDDIKNKIDEFGELAMQIDRMNNELGKLTKKYKEIESELRPVMDELAKHKQRSLETDKYLLTIKRMGYERSSYSYQKAFSKSLEKVNSQTRKVLEGILESTKKISQVATSIGVQPSEGVISNVFKKISGFFKKLISNIRSSTKSMDVLEKIGQKMVASHQENLN